MITTRPATAIRPPIIGLTTPAAFGDAIGEPVGVLEPPPIEPVDPTPGIVPLAAPYVGAGGAGVAIGLPLSLEVLLWPAGGVSLADADADSDIDFVYPAGGALDAETATGVLVDP